MNNLEYKTAMARIYDCPHMTHKGKRRALLACTRKEIELLTLMLDTLPEPEFVNQLDQVKNIFNQYRGK